jgi:tetratricopeptide (TPR) repeat protein
MIAEYDIPKARALAQEALTEAPDDPAAVNLMGLVDNADHQHADAARWFHKAAALDPSNEEYLVNAGYAYVLSGDFERARSEFDRALEINPDSHAALQNIVWITKVAYGDPLIGRISDLANCAEPGSERYVKLHYALGKCLDDAGDYDAAFAAYARANESQPSRYNAAEHESFFSAVAAVWTHDRIARLKPHGDPSEKPVFVVGMPRSGSTLLEEKLASDPRIAGLGEVPDIIRMSGVMTREHPQRLVYPYWCANTPEHAFGGMGRIYLTKYAQRHPQADRLINKSLLNFPYVGLIASMFPNAAIIETRRNPIDTCLSCYFKDFKAAHQYATRLPALGHLYRLYDDNMRHWRARVDRVVTVQYESFVQDVDGGTAALKSAMGLDGDAVGQSQPRYVQTFSAWQVRQPVYTHAVQRWKNYEKHLGPLIHALGDLAG